MGPKQLAKLPLESNLQLKLNPKFKFTTLKELMLAMKTMFTPKNNYGYMQRHNKIHN